MPPGLNLPFFLFTLYAQLIAHMRFFHKASLLLLVFLLAAVSLQAQLQVVAQSNAQALVDYLLGQGVSVSNISLRADARGTGIFKNLGGNAIGIDSGIVLTNGRAKTEGNLWGVDGNGLVPAHGGPPSAFASLMQFPLATPSGDRDLERLIGVGENETHDACVLEFDFVPLGDTVKFNYVFSSEEYPDFTCSEFNDAFAFFISGPGIVGLQNIALIPGSSAPVTINNISDDLNCALFPQYYVNNFTNTFFTHNGHTTIFTAISKVEPCQTYHLKLVIADVSDGILDSGVFLEAKSLSSNAVTLQNTTQVDQQNNSYLVEGCATGSFKVKRPRAEASPLPVTLSYTGTATNGVDMLPLPGIVTIPSNQTEVTVNVVPIIDNMPEGIETIKIFALAGCGTIPTDSTVIQIRDYDTLGITPDTISLCKNSTVVLTASPGYSQYTWDPNPTLSNLNIRTPVAAPTAPFTTYYCTATEGTCHGRDSSWVMVKTLDFLSKKDINCKNASTGEIRVSGGFEWTGPVQYSINNGPYQPDSTFSNLPVGNYVVRIKDASGCIDSLLISLVQAYPDLLITGIAVVPVTCTGGGADGVVTVSTSGGKAPYAYSVDGVNFQSSNVFRLPPGNYTVTLRDDNNCTSTQPVTVTLDNILTLDAGTDPVICEGKTQQLIAHSNGLAFTWTPAASLNDPNIPNPVASPVSTTRYYVTATIGICSMTDSVTVLVNPAPKAHAGADQTICYGQNTVLTGSGGTSYFWSPSANLDNPRVANPTAIQLNGSISYYLHVSDANGCNSLKRDTVRITVTRPAIVFAGRDTVLAINQPLPLHAVDVNNIGFIQYTWSPAYGLNDASIQNPVAIPDKDITYTLTARNSIGCIAVDDIKVKVYKGPNIYVPNAFTPNGDGLNDRLRAIPVGIRDFHYFRLFDRWGNMIFSTEDPLYGWDGKIRGTAQPTSTYVWIAEGVDYRGNIIQRKGTVTIAR